MIVIEEKENRFCPFVICEICQEKIIGSGTAMAAYIPNIGGRARVIFVHKNTLDKMCSQQAYLEFGNLNTQSLEHHFHMLLNNTKIKFSSEDLENFSFLESI